MWRWQQAIDYFTKQRQEGKFKLIFKLADFHQTLHDLSTQNPPILFDRITTSNCSVDRVEFQLESKILGLHWSGQFAVVRISGAETRGNFAVRHVFNRHLVEHSTIQIDQRTPWNFAVFLHLSVDIVACRSVKDFWSAVASHRFPSVALLVEVVEITFGATTIV